MLWDEDGIVGETCISEIVEQKACTLRFLTGKVKHLSVRINCTGHNFI